MFRVIVGKRAALAVGKKGYRKQTIGVFFVDDKGVEDDFATPIAVLRGPEDKDYPAGEYTLHASSFGSKADEFGGSYVAAVRLILQPRVADASRKTA